MKLLANTVLFYNNSPVNYEILLLQDMILFKPYFYDLEPYFPCIILSRFARGWQFPEKVDEQIEKQIREDLKKLKITNAT